MRSGLVWMVLFPRFLRHANTQTKVTGFSSGIGRAIAELVASKPRQRLVATARNPSSLSYLPDTESILKLQLDVASPTSVEQAFKAAAAHFGDAFYHASKFAVEGWSESFARELSPDWNISVCIVEPGGVKTEFEHGSKKYTSVHPAYDGETMPWAAARGLGEEGCCGGRWGCSVHPRGGAVSCGEPRRENPALAAADQLGWCFDQG